MQRMLQTPKNFVISMSNADYSNTLMQKNHFLFLEDYNLPIAEYIKAILSPNMKSKN